MRRQARSRSRVEASATDSAGAGGGGRRPAPGSAGVDGSTATEPPASRPRCERTRGDRVVAAAAGTRSGGCRRARAAAEQQPAAAARRGVRRGRPPGDDLRLGAGERDVEQPQVLAALLARCALGGAVGSRRRPGRRRAARAARRRRGTAGSAGSATWRSPANGHVDDRELEALAGVDGDQLHRGGVGVEPAGALRPRVRAGLGDPAAQPVEQRGEPEPLAARPRRAAPRPMWRRSVSRRSPPTSAEHPRGQAAGAWRPRAARRRRGRRTPRPTPAAGRTARRSRRRPPASSCGGVRPTKQVSAAPRAPGAAVRLLQRLEQRQPLLGRRRARTRWPPPAMTAGTPAASSASRTRRDVGVACRRSPRRRRGCSGRVPSPSAAPRRSQQPDDVAGEVARRRAAARRPTARGRGAACSPTAPRLTQPDRRASTARRPAGVPVCAASTSSDHDPLVAERGAAEQPA